MNLNIFDRKSNDAVSVPRIEVQGDRINVHRDDQGQAQEVEPQNSGQENPEPETRSYHLPKTKWWLH